MKTVLKIAGGVVSAAWMALSLRAAEPASITVQADKPGAKISPALYGIFFEEINRAGDGGIYAEMVQNRSFEDATVPVGWSLVAAGGAEGTISLDTSTPLNANNPTCLRIEISKAGGGRVGAASDGFKGAPYNREQDQATWLPAFEAGAKEFKSGISVKQGATYRLSIYARCGNGFAGPLAVTIEKRDGTALASTSIDGVGADWKKYDGELKASATDPDARLVVTASKTGTVWIDMVSLMPADTYKGLPFRRDLCEMLAEMKPAFVRFPGGCWVEGDWMKYAYRWKRTIGDVAERPGLWNRWGYYSNDGLGHHEYLLLCEALGAEPLFVINCGMAHKDVVLMDRMDEFVQDALDAIEYANGPADSPWGSRRAKAGHPAPFNMKYIEIGNENGGTNYVERYALFYDAIRKRYPDMKIIVDYRPTGTRPADIVDEHYYNTPEFFMRNAGKYDTYDRQGPAIYVGEYAVTRGGVGRGNLRGAVGEAAFMTGLERNGDIVVLSSYAPLFEHVGWKRWNPNGILFDAARCYGTPSWQVQAMFGHNRADTVLPVEVRAPPMESAETRGGQIGVGTWRTQAEYKDIKVTQGGKVLFESDFSKGTKGWKFVGGDWKAVDGALRQTAKEDNLRALAGRKEWVDYTLTLKARKMSGSEGFLILFAVQKDDEKSWWNIGGWGNRNHGLEIRGVQTERVAGSIETGRWYDIKVEVQGGAIRCYLDGKLIHDMRPSALTSLYAVAGRKDDTGEIILKIVNAAPRPVETAIELKGAGKLPPEARGWLLTSANPDDENSFDEPTKVSPKEGVIRIPGASFKHTFPAQSVSVWRLKGD